MEAPSADVLHRVPAAGEPGPTAARSRGDAELIWAAERPARSAAAFPDALFLGFAVGAARYLELPGNLDLRPLGDSTSWGAFFRRELRWFVIGLPLVGILSVPLSYLLLEQWHLAIIPQFQPARALLYTVTISSILCGVAGVRAALRKHLAEAAAWFLVVIAIPLNVRVFDLLHLEDRLSVQVFGIWIGLAVATALLIRFATRWWLRPLALVAPVLAVFSLPTLAHVQTFPKIDKKPVTELARWAKKNTWGSSMFLFPDVGHDLYPGIFRALSERALYVDWKSGGQVNYFESLADEWYSRFEQTMDGKFTAARLQDMLSLPVDYYVLERQHRDCRD